MTRCLAVAAALVACILLAGCAGSRTRGGGTPSGVDHAAAPGGPQVQPGFRDDVNAPQSRRYRQGEDATPDGAGIDIASLPEPVPEVEPHSRYGNKSPYTVLGHTYHVLASPDGYDERGIASYYGTKFHGYMTSDFEKYDMYKFSAAHKTLPLPSYARVTNLANGRSVIVRINDRGPFAANRLIDLSYAAAVRIGIWPKGTGLVDVRAIDPAHPDTEPPSSPVVTTQKAGNPQLYLQVGAFADPANAAHLAAQLEHEDIGQVRVVDARVDGRLLKRVQIGPLAGVEEADRLTAQIERMGLPHPQVAVQ